MSFGWSPFGGVRVSRPPLVGEPPPAAEKPTLFSGLDLGQAQDFTALVVVERAVVPDPAKPGRTSRHFAARHVQRFELGTPYPKVVERVKAMYAPAAPPLLPNPLTGTRLAIDATGVGRPVVDMFRVADIRASLAPYSITAGSGSTAETVSKVELVSCLQVLLQERRLKIAPGLAMAATLAKELEMFRAKVTASRNEVFESWRERDHDDLVLALALAVWVASRPVPKVW